MDNPLETRIDLGLVNYIQHPENERYVVFRYADENRAQDFKSELTSLNIWFEESKEAGRTGKMFHLFGIHKTDFLKAQDLNILVESRHRKPIVRNIFLRYALVIFGLGILTLALIGYFIAKK